MTTEPENDTARSGLTGGEWALIGGLVFFILLTAAIGIWATWDKWSFGPLPEDGTTTAGGTEEEGLSFANEFDTAAASSAFTAAFVDIKGDPLIIRFSETDTAKTTRSVPKPPRVPYARVPGELILVTDVMVSAEQRFVTTLPSSAEDFAFFQSQQNAGRARSVDPSTANVDLSVADQAQADGTGDDSPIGDETAGWGETIDKTTEALPDFTETAIENTTSITYVRPQRLRDPLARDIIVVIKYPRDLAGLLEDTGFFPADAKAAGEQAEALFGVTELNPGQVVAMRGQPQLAGKLGFLQMAIYNEEFLGALAMGDDGQIGEASDPWFEQDLFDYVEGEKAEETAEQKYRMLDAFYSAAIRNKIPSNVVGEAIAILSKSHDLDAFANPGDKMSFLYAAERGEEDTGTGQILYIALKGEAVDIECFVYRSEPGGDYTCYALKPKASGATSGGLANGMVTPVKGVLTSRFGPRNHPVLKTVRIHKGVDWAAPTGTPIYAAFDGTVAYAGDGKGYGNLIKLKHKSGFETRYAHLSKFNTKAGATVRAGEVIGFVGTTGLSTGPHLHFELHLNGTAIDPFASAGGSATGSQAVEQLVNQIIRVESAGNARAKNPLSSATGLGQFINSTWIRMMKTYRPDLAATLSTKELLELRFDPTISREMVANLAKEGESYLRARGHGITAGRLYLCHFLGADGAHKVLSSPDSASLLEVLGAGVIGANPFLKGKDVAYIKAWAERKMSGKRGPVVVTSAPVVIREPDGLPEYRKEIQAAVRAF